MRLMLMRRLWPGPWLWWSSGVRSSPAYPSMQRGDGEDHALPQL